MGKMLYLVWKNNRKKKGAVDNRGTFFEIRVLKSVF